jgi:ribonucleotide reductase beta subunit family protein with ferritin-like domain
MTDIVEFKENIKKTEELLKDSADRSQKIYQPVEGWIIEYPEFDKIVDQQMHTFWPHDEHKVSNDVDDLRVNATYAERESIIYCLMLFTHYELRVGDDYWMNRIGKRFKRPEFQRMATMFAAVEMNSHAPFYNQANQVLYLDNEEFYSKWKIDDTLSARMEFISAVASSKDDLISIAGFSLIEGAVLYSNFIQQYKLSAFSNMFSHCFILFIKFVHSKISFSNSFLSA